MVLEFVNDTFMFTSEQNMRLCGIKIYLPMIRIEVKRNNIISVFFRDYMFSQNRTKTYSKH